VTPHWVAACWPGDFLRMALLLWLSGDRALRGAPPVAAWRRAAWSGRGVFFKVLPRPPPPCVGSTVLKSLYKMALCLVLVVVVMHRVWG
jgi:hypothetical protein